MIYCTCKPGFSYSGAETTFIGRNGWCDDVNECFIASTCPKRATCVNTFGSFYCTCKAGFAVASGEIHFTNSSLTCDAIDECYLNPTVCGPYTICTSKGNGRHDCSCSEGFSPTDGVWITGRTKCIDIDECRKISSCPERSSCQNTNGSFYCICDSGYSWWNQTGRGECLGTAAL
ncbi:adhesion G protein-coupled receptor E1-like [Lissotriton helveticus]